MDTIFTIGLMIAFTRVNTAATTVTTITVPSTVSSVMKSMPPTHSEVSHKATALMMTLMTNCIRLVCHGASGQAGDHRRTGDGCDQVLLGHLRPVGAVVAAVPQHLDPVRDGLDVTEIVADEHHAEPEVDRKSTRLNSSHVVSSYAA